MEVFRFVFGALALVVGCSMLFCRERIAERHRARGMSRAPVPMYWVVLGGLFILIGLGWLISGFAGGSL